MRQVCRLFIALHLILFIYSSFVYAGEDYYLSVKEAWRVVIQDDGSQKRSDYSKVGDALPGVVVQRKGGSIVKNIKVGDRIYTGDTVTVTGGVNVTFSSSRNNELTTKSGTTFIVSNITDKGESYYLKMGSFLSKVFARGFFNLTHGTRTIASRGTIFDVTVDEEKRVMTLAVNEGEVEVTTDYSIKVADKDKEITGLKRVEIVSARTGKTHSVRYNLGTDEAFQEFRNYDDVLKYFEQQLAEDEKTGDDLKLLADKNNIGITLYYLARYDDALKMFDSVSETAKRLSNEGWIATSYNNIGSAWDSKGSYDKAIEFYEKDLKISLKVFGEEHPSVATSYNNIGLAWKAKGSYDKAIEFYEKALKIQLKVFGEEHPSVATSYNNIGLAWKAKGSYDKAIEFYEKALKIQLKVFGEEHPSVAISYNNIGSAWKAKGSYDKAIEYLERAVDILKRFVSPEHPNLITIKKNLEEAKQRQAEQK
ncbi:MAG: tetratricopeptide repeat protein [Nitrospirae bacterium]|nr:tetratricopeptide repeat protein [Nitrospirota bacterium]